MFRSAAQPDDAALDRLRNRHAAAILPATNGKAPMNRETAVGCFIFTLKMPVDRPLTSMSLFGCRF